MGGKQARYFETAALMDEALLQLLADKDLEFITVKEICARAGVNRSTFYLHYETIDDLLQECVEYMNKNFLAEMQGVDVDEIMSRIGSDVPKEDLYFITPEFLYPYLRYIEANKRLFATTLKRPEALRLDKTYRDMLAYVITPVLDRFQVPENDRGYLMAFFMKGLMAIIEHWVSRDCVDDVEHVAAIIQGLVLKPNERRV